MPSPGRNCKELLVELRHPRDFNQRANSAVTCYMILEDAYHLQVPLHNEIEKHNLEVSQSSVHLTGEKKREFIRYRLHARPLSQGLSLCDLI